MAGIPADPDGTPALSEPLGRFLAPLRVDVDAMHRLSERFLDTFTRLAAESTDQFLPTPISDAILRPVGRRGSGR